MGPEPGRRRAGLPADVVRHGGGNPLRHAGLGLITCLAVAACTVPVADGAERRQGRPFAATSAPPDPSQCPLPESRFDCDLQRRIVAAERYLTARPGITGLVVRDRRSDAVWSNVAANRPVFAASTVKLAIAVDLFERERTTGLRLTSADRARIDAMLHTSDGDAANTLWFRFGGDAIGSRFARYGMPGATYVAGLARRWGSMKATAADLDRLVGHALEQTTQDVRRYLVNGMRTVAANQRWGVWAAGPSAQPGTKNGWHEYDAGWVVNSFGFLGPDGRYTLSIMNDLLGEGGYEDGVRTTSEVTAMLFATRFTR